MRPRNKIVFKAGIMIFAFIPAVLLFSLDFLADPRKAAPFFMLPVFAGAFFWQIAGGTVTALLSNFTTLSLTWYRHPKLLTQSLVLPCAVLICFGVMSGIVLSKYQKLKKAKDLLLQKEANWRILFEAIPDGLVIIELEEHRIIDINRSAEMLIGKSKDELIGAECFSHICTTKKGECPVTDLHQEVDSSERFIINDKNEVVPVIKNVRRFEIDNRALLIESFSDIRILRETEQKLAKSTMKYRYLFEELPVPMFSCDTQGNFKSSNSALKMIIDVDNTGELHKKNLRDIFRNEIELEYFFSKLETDKVIKNLQTNLTNENGEKLIVLITAHIISDLDGNEAIEGSFIDITTLLELEDKQRQLMSLETRSRHLDSITKLAAGMAHDINNILAGIHGHAQVIKLKSEDKVLQNSVNRITSGVEKADSILQGLMTSIGSYDVHFEKINIVNCLTDFLNEFREENSENISIRFFSMDDDIGVSIDQNLFKGMMSELLTNSINASESGSQILVTVALEKPGKLIYNFLKDDSAVTACISIIDKGRGIEEELIERIFEPYFTSKDFGSGAGIGLSRVYGIVQKHGGAIGLETELDKGTSFFIYLPVYD